MASTLTFLSDKNVSFAGGAPYENRRTHTQNLLMRHMGPVQALLHYSGPGKLLSVSVGQRWHGNC